MSAVEFSSLLIGLKAFRTEFKRLNRTVRHVMSLASQGTGVVRGPRCQQIRHVPFPGGVRRDLYSWDFLDSQVSGEADLRRFSRLAQRVGGAIDGLEGTPAARLLPGSFQDVVGNQANLFRHDYWLFVVHHLGWIGHLPFECRRRWKIGRTIRDKEFSLRSDLPVNIVQASIDALSILIGAIAQEPVDAEPDPDHATGVLEPHSNPRRPKKRAWRATGIEVLKKELIEHIKAAKDFAQAAVDHGQRPELLPRPSRNELAERVGMAKSAASRCFSDPNASELNMLWELAADLDAVTRFVRH